MYIYIHVCIHIYKYTCICIFISMYCYIHYDVPLYQSFSVSFSLSLSLSLSMDIWEVVSLSRPPISFSIYLYITYLDSVCTRCLQWKASEFASTTWIYCSWDGWGGDACQTVQGPGRRGARLDQEWVWLRPLDVERKVGQGVEGKRKRKEGGKGKRKRKEQE